MNADVPARELLQRCQAGDGTAAGELYRRYAPRLVRLAEGQLTGRVRRREDADDVIQSVFRTFFRRAADGEYSVQHSGALWNLLTYITRQKLGRVNRRHHAAKRDVNAEVYPGDSAGGPAAEVPYHEELTALLDEIEHLLAGFAPLHVKIIHGILEGQSVLDVAREVHRSRSTVRRVLMRALHRLRGRLESDP